MQKINTLATAFFLLTALPGAAQTVSDADMAQIQDRIAAFDTVMRNGDLAGTFAFVPGKIKAHIAGQFGVSEAELETAMQTQLAGALEGISIDEFGMDLASATFAATPDGSSTYGLIPTFTEMTIEGTGKARAESQTLALQDDGEWYLVRVDDANQTAVIKAVYPAFANVDFPPGTLEVAE